MTTGRGHYGPMPQHAPLDTPGARIRVLRKSKGWTQADLAKKVHATQPAIAHWEADRYLPTHVSQVLLAEALGAPRAFLFGEAAA